MGRAVYIAGALVSALAALIVSLGPAPMREGMTAACIVKSETRVAPADLSQGGEHWTCRDQPDTNPTHQSGFARFDLASDGARPRYLVRRLGSSDTPRATVVDRDTRKRSHHYAPDHARMISGAPLLRPELPEDTPPPRAGFLPP